MKSETIEFTWTESASIEIQDGEWRKMEASLTRGGLVEDGVDAEKAAVFLQNRVKQAVKDEIQGEINAVMALRDEPAAETFAKEVEAATTFTPEEAPPLPEETADLRIAGDVENGLAPLENDTPPEIVRTPLADNEASFFVRYFEVAKTGAGDKYLKTFGKGKWSRKWVPAWSDVAELLFDDIESMDLGEIPAPYPLEATVEMGEWTNPKTKKTAPSPNKVLEWTRVG